SLISNLPFSLTKQLTTPSRIDALLANLQAWLRKEHLTASSATGESVGAWFTPSIGRDVGQFKELSACACPPQCIRNHSVAARLALRSLNSRERRIVRDAHVCAQRGTARSAKRLLRT